MSGWLLAGLIILVLGIVISNIMLLKKSANQDFSSSLTRANKPENKDDKTGS